MNEYGATEAQHNHLVTMNELLARIHSLEAERDRLRAALERYANEAPGWLKPIARRALEDPE